MINAHLEIDPGFLVSQSDTLTTQQRCQGVRDSKKTVTYWTDNPSTGIFVFAFRVKTSKCFTLFMSPVLFSVFGTETIRSDEGSIDILDTF